MKRGKGIKFTSEALIISDRLTTYFGEILISLAKKRTLEDGRDLVEVEDVQESFKKAVVVIKYKCVDSL